MTGGGLRDVVLALHRYARAKSVAEGLLCELTREEHDELRRLMDADDAKFQSARARLNVELMLATAAEHAR